MYAALNRRYGSATISVNLPGIGHAVVISDPALAKDLFSTSTDLVERPTWGGGSLGDAFGPGSTFSLGGDQLLARRKVVVPHFHGKRMRSYEPIIEEER
jgi:cytochrome P450